MSFSKSWKESTTTALHENAERIAKIIELTTFHHFLCCCGCGSTRILNESRTELRKQLTMTQIQVVETAFDVIKTLLPALKTMNKDKKFCDSDLRSSLECQWTDFTGCLELFSRDLSSVFFILSSQERQPTSNSFLDRSGVATGIHASLSHLNAPKISTKDGAKEEAKPPAKRIEDSIRKIEKILHSLNTNMAVHAWTVEHYSSIHIDSTVAKTSTRFKKSMRRLIRSKPQCLAVICIALIIALVLTVLLLTGVV